MATSGVRRPSRKGCPNHAVEFKRRLAAAACAPGVSVAKLALEHGVNTNLLFRWRRQYQAGKFGARGPAPRLAPKPPGLPVVMPRPKTAVSLLPVHAPTADDEGMAAPPCIEVVFGCATVRIRGAPEMAPLRMVLDCLTRHA